MPVMYFGGKEDVQLGDRVSIRIWLRKRTGRVVYAPGVSPLNPEFGNSGMQWVGIRLENGALVATPVLRRSSSLKKKVHLVNRDTSPCQLITPESRELEEHGEGPAL